jgi:hypothetical protein
MVDPMKQYQISKTTAALLVSLFISSLANAATFAELDLTVGMSVNSSGTKYHKTGTVKCNPAGRNPDREHFDGGLKPISSTEGNGTYAEASKTVSYDLRTNYADAHWMNPRNFTVSIKNETAQDGSVAEITLTDRQKLSQSDTNRGTCSHTDWVAKANKDLLNGKIRVGYVMPPNTWAVRVKRTKAVGVFGRQLTNAKSSALASMMGLLNLEKDPRVVNEEFVAWAEPGSKIYQEFAFDNLNEGGEVNGTYSVKFTPIAEIGSGDTSQTLLKSLVEKTELALRADPKSFVGFVDLAVGLLANPTKLKAMTSDSKTTAVYKLTNSLSQIANQPLDAKGFWDVRAAASILAFEISLSLLDDFSPYCDVQAVNLPFSGTMNVSGMRLAYMYLSRAQSRLENYRFSQYSAYLDQLVSYQQANLTYAKVRTDAKRLRDMKKAYELLQNSVGEITPFAAALSEIKYVLSKFKSVGAGESTTENLVKDLSALAGVEDAFIRDFILRLRDFKASNTSVVQADDLRDRLNAIVESQQRVVEMLDNNVRFLSIDGDTDQSSFTGMIQTLISNNIAVFEKPLQWSTLERIRSVYKKADRVEATVTQAKKCLL